MSEYGPELEAPDEPEPEEFDLGDAVDDEGGASEYRHYAAYQELDRAEAARDARDMAEEAFNRRQAELDAEPQGYLSSHTQTWPGSRLEAAPDAHLDAAAYEPPEAGQ